MQGTFASFGFDKVSPAKETLEIEKNVMGNSAVEWLEKTLCEQLNCASIEQLTESKVMTLRKDVIAKLLYQSLKYNYSQNKAIVQSKSGLETCKTDLINSQQRVINIQEELLLSKSELYNKVFTIYCADFC